MVLGEGYQKYSDLISAQDLEFWNYLCKKDFKRLQKLMNEKLGDGYFMDDSDSDDSEGEKKVDSGDDNGL